MYCKSLWIKASAKCININVNVLFLLLLLLLYLVSDVSASLEKQQACRGLFESEAAVT